jgi:hypothetical protein
LAARVTAFAGLLLGVVSAHAQLGSSGYVEQMSFFNAYPQNVARTPHANVTTYSAKIGVGTSSGLNVVEFASDPAPFVLAKTSGQNSNPIGSVDGAAYGRMIYVFTLQGAANSSIPLSFYGSARIQASPGPGTIGTQVTANARFALGSALVDLSAREGSGWDQFTVTGTNADVSRINRLGDAESGYFSGTVLFQTDANGKASGTVDLTASTSFGGRGTGTTVGQAYIDPLLFIDPVWQSQHQQVTLAILPGVGNSVLQVPEPTTLLSMLAGLGRLVVRRRRGRQA